MANTNSKLNLLKEIHKKEESLYSERNQKYGDSFSKTFEKRGSTAALIRLEDKLSRADYLLSHGLEGSDGESVVDTLMDLSNYANMTIMELLGSKEDTPEDQNQNTPKKPKKAKKDKKTKKSETPEENSPKENKKDEGPLDTLNKKQLMSVLTELGATFSKKASRTELMGQISDFPKAQVAVAVTSLSTEKDVSEDTPNEEA